MFYFIINMNNFAIFVIILQIKTRKPEDDIGLKVCLQTIHAKP